jgi:hypothetical protein
MVVHTCNPSTQEPKTGGSRVTGQPVLYRTQVRSTAMTTTQACSFVVKQMFYSHKDHHLELDRNFQRSDSFSVYIWI